MVKGLAMIRKSKLRSRCEGAMLGTRGTGFPFMSGKNSSPPSYLYYGTFTAANGTPLASYTPEVGAAFSIDSGTWEINNNAARMTDNTDGRLCHVDVGASNYIMTASLVSDSWADRFPGMVFRFVDSSNFWLAQIQGTLLILYECTAGGFTSRASQTVSVVNGVPGTFQAVVGASSISVTFNGTPVSYSSTQHNSATKVGFRFGASTPNPSNATYYDSLIVQ